MGENTTSRLKYVPSEEMGQWRCRPLGEMPVLDLKDRNVGRFDGLVLDAANDKPLFLVIRRAGSRRGWFLVPVGDAWFDDTERAIRIDPDLRQGRQPSFDPDEFVRMSPEEAMALERRVLAECCPEVGLHRDGTPDYGRLASFQCPTWLRPSSGPSRADQP